MSSKALLFIFIFSLCGFTQLQSQTDIQTLYSLAKQAREEGEFDKAISYLEELYNETNSEVYYSDLFELYGEKEDFSAAEKMIKKRIKKLPKKGQYVIDLGYLYQLQGEERKAEKSYEEAIDNIGTDSRQSRIMANQFTQYGLFNYAEKTFRTARKETKNYELFRFEIANTMAQQGKTEEMVEEYLSILESNRSYIQSVQNVFQRVLNPDPDGTQKEMIKNQLLRRIQKNPNLDVFSELLIWLFIQDKNFNGAFVQAKALDKRLNENGKRLFSLGTLSLSNENYQVAEKSFQYVVELGEDSPYYLQAKMKLVETLKDKITKRNDYTQEDLLKLKSAYQKTLDQLGISYYTLPVLRGLAELNAYYLDSVTQAIDILQTAIKINGVKSADKAETKIELADLMLLDGEIWEASLLYSQVEKAFKYDRLGEVAKFKNAKIAFYTGDFYWAQAQLDVLKGSTSKLIANDALDLSLLITDNVGLDSIAEPLEMYARADLLLFKKNFDEAEKVLDSIPKFFPASSLKDEVLFKKFEIEFQKRNYEAAAERLRKLIADYAEDLLGDDALFALAKLEEEILENKETAMELYKQLITTYPSSLFVVESRKRFRALRGDKLTEEELNKGI